MASDFSAVVLSPTSLVWQWQRVWSQFLDAAMAAGWDPVYGARLRGDLHAAGLVDVHADYITRSSRGGSLPSRLLSLTVERLRQRMVPLGADPGEIDEARRLLEDAASTITSPTTCMARGALKSVLSTYECGRYSASIQESGDPQDDTVIPLGRRTAVRVGLVAAVVSEI